MTPWKVAVNRPVLTTMFTLIIVLFGIVSLLNLPIDLMPDITWPTLTVSSSYSNAGPEEIEELITRRLEETLVSVSAVEEVSSTSSEGNSRVRVAFAWGTSLDEASNDIRDRLDRVIGRLPEDADRPTLRKFDINSFPVMLLGARSNLNPVQMRKIIDEQVKYRIERVPGVAALDVLGGLEREIHVDIDPGKVKALGLSLDQIVSSIRSGNVETPAGIITRGKTEISMRTKGNFDDINDISSTVIAMRDGAPVKLGDIASVEDSWRDVTRLVRINGGQGLQLAVNKQSGMNTVDVARGVLRELDNVNRDIPQIKITPIIDSSQFIQKSISNVSQAALAGGLLAIIVLLFFLRDIRSTIVVAVAIPVSIIATFALMYFADFTLNIMTLGGLALGIGMLVDNAIVVLENIYRMKEEGKTAEDAAISGSSEVAAAIIASTLTTIVVFLPMLFMQGMAGVMFRQLAYIVAFSLFCSLLIALTIVPMMASRMIGKTTGKHVFGNVEDHSDNASADILKRTSYVNRVSQKLESLFESVEDQYSSLLKAALCHRALTIISAVALLGLSLALIPLVGTELMPATDEGELRVSLEMEAGVSLEVMDAKTLEVEKIVNEIAPEIDKMITMVGGTPWGRGSGRARSMLRITLVDRAQRSRSTEMVSAELRKALTRIPGVTVRVRASSGMPMMRRMTSGNGERLQIEIRGYDMDVADALARKVKETVEEVDGVTDASLSREKGIPEEVVRVDRERAADLGLTISQIGNALRTALSGTIAGQYREGGDEFPIRVRLEDSTSMTVNDVLDLTVRNSSGESISLRNVISIETGEGPQQINRLDQDRVITVSAEISERDMGSVIEDLRNALATIPVPRNFQILLSGDYEEQQKAFRELFLSLILSLIMVYMVMAGLYESMRDPFIVMFSVPLAAIGVIWLLFVTETTFNIQSFIGIIMLGGIVVNNAILLVDYTNLLRERDGMPLLEAISEAGRRRLRPILMTTLTTVLGLIPLALGLGDGGEAQAPMARAVIGGLLSSTMITLVFIPVIYSIFTSKKISPREKESTTYCIDN